MANVQLYIASTLDGYIADVNGSIEWLTSFPNPDEEDYGYTAFLDCVDTLIMGHSTYQHLLELEPTWHYPSKKTWVVTSKPNLSLKTPNTFPLFINHGSSAKESIQKETGNIWLVGGGETIAWMQTQDLIDEMLITYVPITLGRGISLFPPADHISDWLLLKHTAYPNGFITLHYQKKK